MVGIYGGFSRSPALRASRVASGATFLCNGVKVRVVVPGGRQAPVRTAFLDWGLALATPAGRTILGAMSAPPGPQRTVHQADALTWLPAQGRPPGTSIITSLPDVSEVPALGFEGWARFFEESAALVCAAVPDDGVAIFFQSDIRHGGLWVDKGAMVARAAERAGVVLLFHKIVCRKPPGTVTRGRASYSHLLGFARGLRPPAGLAGADVLPDAGFVPGRKAMGVAACLDACRFIQAATTCHTVVDPFCGWGTALAVANALGLDAVGVDLSARMCRRARRLHIDIAATKPRSVRP
jgi:hypothetical protein